MRDYPVTVFRNVLWKHLAKTCDEIANLSCNGEWTGLITKLESCSYFVNFCRLPEKNSSTPPTLYTPLHQAAYGKAPTLVFEKLLTMGASKTLKTAGGETAYDIGKRNDLNLEILKMIEVPEEIRNKENEIKKMEEGLHKVILGRAVILIKKNGQELPQLAYLYEFGSFHYGISGMYGGFNVETHEEGIIAESWCRIIGGSGQRHVIDREGKSRLVEKGFV